MVSPRLHRGLFILAVEEVGLFIQPVPLSFKWVCFPQLESKPRLGRTGRYVSALPVTSWSICPRVGLRASPCRMRWALALPVLAGVFALPRGQFYGQALGAVLPGATPLGQVLPEHLVYH